MIPNIQEDLGHLEEILDVYHDEEANTEEDIQDENKEDDRECRSCK